MIEINGKFTTAKIYTNLPQQAAIEQIDELVNQSFMSGTKVRIMPDYHAGKGCVDEVRICAFCISFFILFEIFCTTTRKTWILIKPTLSHY
ncbi:hypothetical protein LZ480_00080 [Solibacillus sp. MA9]|uniref:3'-phosphate/5'-hydroxy nucleic acid ligase n=1 Tax=Solibacillus palustris TaxID=2908203 RepID=A0ABS9U7F6_9BACL|nr:hypothetical protein [Solibacillus sp. MA9]MCH7320268.1 hypothetical protein [Solibacillus sp. MA9]